VGADAALVAVEGSGTPTFRSIDVDAGIVRAYEEHYASVDVGIARQRSLSIDVWSRCALWGAAELRHSEYYNDFARPNRLLDAMGISARARAERVRVSFISTRAVRGRTAGARRLGLLELLLPAFRTGVALSMSTGECRNWIADVIDCTDHPLAVCDEAGHDVHHNGALDRAAAVLGGEQLVGAIAHVTRAVAVARKTSPSGGVVSMNLATPSGEWRVRGSTLPWEVDTPSPTILVSVARIAPTSASAVALRSRYGLTAREAQVMELLCRRRSNAEIARALCISAHTARHHTESVLLKLGLQSRTQVEERLTTEERADCVEPRKAQLDARDAARTFNRVAVLCAPLRPLRHKPQELGPQRN
jgi:DNA-binding CsgD family transcriptional regulator